VEFEPKLEPQGNASILLCRSHNTIRGFASGPNGSSSGYRYDLYAPKNIYFLKWCIGLEIIQHLLTTHLLPYPMFGWQQVSIKYQPKLQIQYLHTVKMCKSVYLQNSTFLSYLPPVAAAFVAFDPSAVAAYKQSICFLLF
jgi:hypothetical protein